jgi:hypothetical protein
VGDGDVGLVVLDGLRKRPLICVLGRARMCLVMKRTRAPLMPATVIVDDDDIVKEVGGIVYQFCDRYSNSNFVLLYHYQRVKTSVDSVTIGCFRPCLCNNVGSRNECHRGRYQLRYLVNLYG